MPEGPGTFTCRHLCPSHRRPAQDVFHEWTLVVQGRRHILPAFWKAGQVTGPSMWSKYLHCLTGSVVPRLQIISISLSWLVILRQQPRSPREQLFPSHDLQFRHHFAPTQDAGCSYSDFTGWYGFLVLEIHVTKFSLKSYREGGIYLV